MEDNKKEIKKGIAVHTIRTNRFKTDLLSVFLTTKLSRENVTKNALIPMILRKGSSKFENVEEINKHLESMYGCAFDCGIDKTGDNQVLKFYLETVDERYLPEGEKIIEECINTILDIVFAPKLENNAFKKDYTESEKEKLKILIEGKKDNKSQYANLRCQEEMYKGTPFGLYKYGYIEDLDGIDEKNLYEYYKELISKCKIDIFVSGDVEEAKIEDIISKNANIQKLNERCAEYNKNNAEFEKHQEREIIEKADVTQGNLVLRIIYSEKIQKKKDMQQLYIIQF